MLTRGLKVRAQDDRGQTVLIVAAVLMGVALTAAAVFLNLDAGKRIIDRLRSGNASQGQLLPAMIAYFQSGGAHTFPCPSAVSGSVPTGVAAASCGAGANAGAVPWKTLGLSKDQAIDAYGNFYTYIVSADDTQRGVCKTVANNFGGASEFTGTIAPPTTANALEVRLSSQAAGAGTLAPFVLVGHGANKVGALSSASKLVTGAAGDELTNCHPGVCATTEWKSIVKGPFTGSTGTTPFDDQVFYPTTAVLEKMCGELTPGGALNATLTDGFNQVPSAGQIPGTGLDASKYSTDTNGVNTGADTRNPGNRVAVFGVAGSRLVTNANYTFDPRQRQQHVSAIWVPDPEGTHAQAGMAIALRSAASYQDTPTDNFFAGGGVTIRYYSSGTLGTSNQVSILANDGTYSTSNAGQSFTLTRGVSYRIEAFDDGAYVWGRITQIDLPSNTAVVGPVQIVSGISGDPDNSLGGPNQVIFVSTGSTGAVNYIDDLALGLGMLAAETDGTQNYLTTTDINLTNLATGSLSVEAWVRLRSTPTGDGVIVAAWDPNQQTPPIKSTFRLSLNAQRQLTFSVAGTNGATTVADSLTAGGLSLDEWTHVAGVYDKTTAPGSPTLSVYINGDLAASRGSTISTLAADNATPITAGADYAHVVNGSSAVGPHDFLSADFSDVRVWTTARTAVQMSANYRTRQSYPAQTGATGLVLNWKMDTDTFASVDISQFTANSTGDIGTLSSPAAQFIGTPLPRYVAGLAVHVRPFSEVICPGYQAGTYECDVRASSTNANTGTLAFTIPANLPGVHTRLWGGGGGGFDNTNRSAGGGGGFSSGTIFASSATLRIGTQNLAVSIGSGGTGSNVSALAGAGGGGATAVGVGTRVLMTAGGGGGASFSNQGGTSLIPCTTATGTFQQCGLGGGGGGVTANPLQAPDAATNLCGGLPGIVGTVFGTNPGNRLCNSTGATPVTATGGGGAGLTGGISGIGATASLGSGGAGVTSTSGAAAAGIAGAGGGGGGVSAVDPSLVPTTGGGGAGGYERFSVGRISVSTAPVENDTVGVRFTNAGYAALPLTASYVAGASETAITGATKLVTAINGLALGGGLSASNDGGTSAVVTVTQHGDLSSSTTVSDQSAPGANHSSGALNLPLAVCVGNTQVLPSLLLLTGPVVVGDIITVMISGPVTATVSSDPAVTTSVIDLAANLAGKLSTVSGVTAANVLDLITINYAPCSTSPMVTVSTSASSPLTITDMTLVSAGTANGFGGGGGGGYAQSTPLVTNTAGQAAPQSLVGTVGKSFGAGSMTITSAAAAAGDQIRVRFNGTNLTNVDATYTAVGGETALQFAVGLANAINATSTLTTQNVSATATNVTATTATVTVRQRGNASFATVVTTALLAGTATTFTLTPSLATSFRLFGFDNSYSPSYLATTNANPGTGGTTGTSVSGSTGAIVILW